MTQSVHVQDMVDQYLTSVRAPKAIAPVIDLTLAQQVICPSVPHQSERLEPAQALSLDVDKVRRKPDCVSVRLFSVYLPALARQLNLGKAGRLLSNETWLEMFRAQALGAPAMHLIAGSLTRKTRNLCPSCL
jgi:hypothetical protein